MAEFEHTRHTLAHLLAAAILEHYPHAKRTIGPAIDTGFYFDFDFSGGAVPGEADLPKIEETMRKLLPSWTGFDHKEVTADEAREFFKDNQYKIELINEFEKEGQKITFYTSGNYTDLCRGGHRDNPAKDIPEDSFKLDRIAGAYWRGDEKNPMLTRIYGLAFENKAALDAYIAQREEADKRDHRKLGKELELFTFSDTVGKGLPLWTPKGATIRRELERFITDEELRRGYLHVYTPDIAKLDLYKKSGHYPYYKDSMYAPIQIDDEEFMLRPMTCPHHFELYLSKPRSYRELPMRIAELAKLYRYEQSGELSGLIRVRGFCLADAHIVCADAKQAADEASKALDLIEYIAGVFGLKMGENYWYRLSLGDRADDKKYFKNDAAWDEAEAHLRSLLTARNAHFVEAEGEGAFYGPKIDVQMKNVRGKDDTAFTVQWDFVMPGRFTLKYTASDGTEKEPIVIHRSSIGAIERVMAFLIEHFAGAFPLWLSPVQVKVLPISDAHAEYAKEVAQKMRDRNIRVELDESNETLGKKIRNATLEKVPYTLVIGDKEVESQTVTVESRDKGKLGALPIQEAVSKLQTEITEKK